jgi:environmental stress-induced protein Ves
LQGFITINMKLISFDDLVATPWKNGGGVTRELACYPAGAALDDFVWRISIAEVNRSGPFSPFPGIDRVITLLEGDGMKLTFSDGEQHALTTPLLPYRFRGERIVNAQLAGTASQDFNLMLRRDAVGGSLQVRHGSGEIACDGCFVALFCARGSWKINAPDGHRHQLDLRQTLTGACSRGTMRIHPLQADSALLCVSVVARQPTGSHHGHD